MLSIEMELLLTRYTESPVNNILESRESRSNYIHQLLEKNHTIVSVKANIPGVDKSVFPADLLVHIFTNILFDRIKVPYQRFKSGDGPFSIFSLEKADAEPIKSVCIQIEEKHKLGRYIDIDVYHKTMAFHREKPRKCILCDNLWAVCAREKKHSLDQLLNKMQEDVYSFLSIEIARLIDESMRNELDLDPKFGLVTKKSNGSHPDMNYQLMIRAKDSIMPFFLQMFHYGMISENDIDKNRSYLQYLGIQAELKMYQATSGVNAYKGLIFHLGYVLFALGKVLKNCQTFEHLFVILKEMNQFYKQEYCDAPDSFGKFLFIEKGIGGAREEMGEGLPNVQEALKNITSVTRNSLYETLRFFITHIEDTTLIKRSSVEQYAIIQNRFSSLNIQNEQEINDLTSWCIEHNYSFGGSADLLVVTLFLFRVKQLFFSTNQLFNQLKIDN